MKNNLNIFPPFLAFFFFKGVGLRFIIFSPFLHEPFILKVSCAWGSFKQSHCPLSHWPHMTLHWSPPGAAMAGDPWLSPISPSRLRPWKAPNKELSFAGAGFLAGVVCYMWKKGGRLLRIFWQAVHFCCYFDFTAHLPSGGSGGSWSEFFWPTSLRSSWPVCLAVVSFGIHHRGNIRAWHMGKQLIHVRNSLILIKQICLAKCLRK